jgi:hypothetical protein
MERLLLIIKLILRLGTIISASMRELSTMITIKKEDKKMNDLFNRVDALMSTLVGRENYNHNAQVIREMFNLHNEVYPNNLEFSTSCGGCRQRVYQRLKQWWSDNKQSQQN